MFPLENTNTIQEHKQKQYQHHHDVMCTLRLDDGNQVELSKKDFEPLLLPSVNVFRSIGLFRAHQETIRMYRALCAPLVLHIMEQKMNLTVAKMILKMVIGTVSRSASNTASCEFTIFEDYLLKQFDEMNILIPKKRKFVIY